MPRSDEPDNQSAATACPCGSSNPYAQCCEPIHRGTAATSAEALMRSRYSAFCLNLTEYIERSWHSSTRPGPEDEQGEKPRWIGLRIQRHEIVDADRAIVEFTARYKLRGRVFSLHEISRFVRENGHWFYLDGTFPRR
jgi:SEC-C motif domain protein